MKKLNDILAGIFFAVIFAIITFMFLNAWANEKPVTLHDHTQGFEQQFADTNWCTEK